MNGHRLIKKFKWLLVSWAVIFVAVLVRVLGTNVYLYHCGYQLRKTCPLIGVLHPDFGFGEKEFLAGAKARLDRDVNYSQLQSWAAGVTPNGPQKEGAPIHLPSGETIIPTDWRGDGFVCGDDGSFTLLTNHLPPTLSALLPEPPRIIVHGNADPARRRVNVGYPDRSGLNIVIGLTNYIYEGLPGLMCTSGIYVFVGGGG